MPGGGSAAFEFNSEKKGWHYGFNSNRFSDEEHNFVVYFFQEVWGQYKCVGIVESDPFRVYSQRRAPKKAKSQKEGSTERKRNTVALELAETKRARTVAAPAPASQNEVGEGLVQNANDPTALFDLTYLDAMFDSETMQSVGGAPAMKKSNSPTESDSDSHQQNVHSDKHDSQQLDIDADFAVRNDGPHNMVGLHSNTVGLHDGGAHNAVGIHPGVMPGTFQPETCQQVNLSSFVEDLAEWHSVPRSKEMAQTVMWSAKEDSSDNDCDGKDRIENDANDDDDDENDQCKDCGHEYDECKDCSDCNEDDQTDEDATDDEDEDDEIVPYPNLAAMYVSMEGTNEEADTECDEGGGSAEEHSGGLCKKIDEKKHDQLPEAPFQKVGSVGAGASSTETYVDATVGVGFGAGYAADVRGNAPPGVHRRFIPAGSMPVVQGRFGYELPPVGERCFPAPVSGPSSGAIELHHRLNDEADHGTDHDQVLRKLMTHATDASHFSFALLILGLLIFFAFSVADVLCIHYTTVVFASGVGFFVACCIMDGRGPCSFACCSYRSGRQWWYHISASASRDGPTVAAGAALRHCFGQSISAGAYEEVGLSPARREQARKIRQRRQVLGIAVGVVVMLALVFGARIRNNRHHDIQHGNAKDGFVAQGMNLLRGKGQPVAFDEAEIDYAPLESGGESEQFLPPTTAHHNHHNHGGGPGGRGGHGGHGGGHDRRTTDESAASNESVGSDPKHAAGDSLQHHSITRANARENEKSMERKASSMAALQKIVAMVQPDDMRKLLGSMGMPTGGSSAELHARLVDLVVAP
jgi:hypothetical protein